ncbi:MMPL family transporter [Kocuria sp. cx-116]|uniref:MMPL family transporter n=1 Tax=Kocuria sp. cx-116 TaxID=2771378 RepID=UPI001682520D|nr:MMPL family transporter [Kocuria sp. cx-116]MBD2763209.1 MMPL family transporter [Kocuria sp. cx-116]
MARLLYRLGIGSARHAWAVIVSWIAVLAISVGAVAFSGVQLSNAITIPGTETQQLADRLQDELPEANQGTGRMVFYTEDGSEFTEEQRQGIADAVASTEGIDQVDSATNPFEAQAQLDDGRQQLVDGRQQLEEGQRAIQQLQENLPPGANADQILQQRGINPQQIQEQQAQLESGEQTMERMGDYRVVSADGNSAISVVNFTVDQTSVTADAKEAVMNAVNDHPVDGVGVDFSQELAQDISSLVGPAEIVGVVIAAIVLLVMLRALVPAILPVLTALIGVGISTAATLAFSGVIDMMSVTPMLGVMLGLAVGIDYSLFVLNRHRQQLRRGMEIKESIGMAVGTSGTAVFFAALTVIVALVALNVTGIPFLGLMGTVAGVAVLIALLITLTLTPALLSLAGRKALPRKQRNAAPDEQHINEHDVPFHLRHPWITSLLSVGVLVVLALPAQDMRLGLPDASTESVDSTSYQAFQRIADDFGAGENGPLVAVVDLPEGLTEDQATEKLNVVSDRIADQDDVANVMPAVTTDDRRAGVIQVIPESGPADAATEELVNNLRGLNGDLQESEDVTIGVAGTTAANIDVSQLLGEKLPLYLGVVIIISLLLLLMVFRSIVVPVIASAGFLLSVLASLGAVVAVYQWGWGGELMGVHDPGPILSFLPTLMIGILFGLAMDYQLFLGSGMREAYVHGHPARQAVVYGFKAGRAVVTAAAIIMISVFAGFIFAHLSMIKPIGFGLAIGVLLDAFVVRMFLIPAVMRIMGEKVWWLPRWLDKILPRVDVEGESLTRTATAGATAGAAGGAATAGAGAGAGSDSRSDHDAAAPTSRRAVASNGGSAAASEHAASGVVPVKAMAVSEVVLRQADPALKATDVLLPLLPSMPEEEDSAREELSKDKPEAAPHRSMHERVNFRKVMVARRPVLVAEPKTRARDALAPVIVYWHGGGYVNAMVRTHWRFLDELIKRTGATVLVPSYALAPVHTVDEVEPLVDGTLELARTLGSHVYFMGDSSGGGLALAQAQRLRDKGVAPLDGLVLIAPWVDVTLTNPEIAEYEAKDNMLSVKKLRLSGRWWAGERDVRDPLVSPAYGSYDRLPRTLVTQGDHDILYPDTMNTVAELQLAGVDTTAIVTEGAPHTYTLMVWSSTARQDVADIARWIMER